MSNNKAFVQRALIQVIITTIIISLSFNSFAEVRKTYYESGGALSSERNFKNGTLL